MVYCFTVSNGMPGYMPNTINAYSVETIEEANAILTEAIADFCEGDYAHKALDFHGMGASGGSASMWSWIMAYANEGAEQLRVDGLTEAEYEAMEGEE